MTDHSHTKLSIFRNYRCKYKLQYIDKIKVDRTKSIESFLGSRVHEALEELYRDRMYLTDENDRKTIRERVENTFKLF